MDEEVITIFNKLDLIILSCQSNKPILFKDSKFLKLYNRLKEEYLK